MFLLNPVGEGFSQSRSRHCQLPHTPPELRAPSPHIIEPPHSPTPHLSAASQPAGAPPEWDDTPPSPHARPHIDPHSAEGERLLAGGVCSSSPSMRAAMTNKLSERLVACAPHLSLQQCDHCALHCSGAASAHSYFQPCCVHHSTFHVVADDNS